MSWRLRKYRLLFYAFLMLGCTSEDRLEEFQEPFSVRDSAGISIAESSRPEWTRETSWRVSPNPVLVIGSREGQEPGTDLGRIHGAVRLDDGRIVVAEGTSIEVRVFDPRGRLLFAVGGPGEGPAEFRSLGQVGVIQGDSIVATDWQGSKLVVFGPEGGLGRTVRTPPIVWNGLVGVFVNGCLQDGSFLVSHSPQRSDLPPGRSTVEREVHLFDPEGNHLGEFARLRDHEANNEGEGRGRIGFGAVGNVDINATGIWYGFSNRYALKHISVEGLDRIIRIPVSPEPTPERLKELVRERSARTMEQDVPSDAPPDVRTRMEEVFKARLDEMAFADSLPLFSGLVAARDGHLWVREYPSAQQLLDPGWDWEGSQGVPRWTVFDPEGRWLGEVDMPEEIQVQEIGADYVLGVRRDELDVPYVVLHRIEKPEGT